METQATQNQEQEPRSYENSPWINVYDWQVTEHTNRETGDSFWSVKLASDTFIEHDGQRVDVGRHVFATNFEPSVTHGEPGTPRCTRGIHFPQDWDITLKRFENVAGKDETPVFKEVNRVEGVTPHGGPPIARRARSRLPRGMLTSRVARIMRSNTRWSPLFNGVNR